MCVGAGFPIVKKLAKAQEAPKGEPRDLEISTTGDGGFSGFIGFRRAFGPQSLARSTF